MKRTQRSSNPSRTVKSASKYSLARARRLTVLQLHLAGCCDDSDVWSFPLVSESFVSRRIPDDSRRAHTDHNEHCLRSRCRDGSARELVICGVRESQSTKTRNVQTRPVLDVLVAVAAIVAVVAGGWCNSALSLDAFGCLSFFGRRTGLSFHMTQASRGARPSFRVANKISAVNHRLDSLIPIDRLRPKQAVTSLCLALPFQTI